MAAKEHGSQKSVQRNTCNTTNGAEQVLICLSTVEKPPIPSAIIPDYLYLYIVSNKEFKTHAHTKK